MALDEDKPRSSDSELLCAIQRGVPEIRKEAMEELYKRHDPKLLEIITGYLRKKNCDQPGPHAEKVKSDAWFSVFTYGRQNVVDFDAWLAVTGINAANNHLKDCIREQNERTEFQEQRLLPQGQAYDFYDTKNAALKAEAILNIADRISPELSLILQLYHLEGYTFDEIAVRLRKPAATVRSIYYRGLRKIKRTLKRRGG